MTTINEGRVLASLNAGTTPLSLRGLETETQLSTPVIRRSLATLIRSGLVEQADGPPQRSWQLSARARRWLDTTIGRAALDVPAISP
ncbi:helix-turn-helix domain-containing protein [Nocardia sp. NPDC056000]|uniref:helix-turn-helix domain-containing protein n=1 Tax=Nocardia sp. NPDC056000 TaxID=3345674 RepID=UPI0035DC5983